MTGVLQYLDFDLLAVIFDVPSTREMGDHVPCRARRCLRVELGIALDLGE